MELLGCVVGWLVPPSTLQWVISKVIIVHQWRRLCNNIVVECVGAYLHSPKRFHGGGFKHKIRIHCTVLGQAQRLL
jgi:hypothetical protein